MAVTRSLSWPLTARVCVGFAGVQLAACLMASFCEVGPMYRGVQAEEVAIFTMARNALIIPMCLIGLVAMYHMAEMCSPQPRQRVLVISRLSMFEFMVKMCYYTLLSRGYGMAFENQRAYDDRPIFGTRWLAWTVAVPTMVFMNLYPMMDDSRSVDALTRLFPQLAASTAYCLTCGLGCILKDPWVGWCLCSLGCLAYLAIIADELAYVKECSFNTSHLRVKGMSVAIKEVMFVLYTVFYLLGNWGWASSYSVELFYSCADIAHMAVMSSLLFLYWSMEDPSLSHKD